MTADTTSVTARLDPVVYRRRLRDALRDARLAAGVSQRDVASAMDWSLSKMIRIETGEVAISINDLRTLLAHYKVDDEDRVTALIDTARKARQRSPWTAYRHVITAGHAAYLGYESSASTIRTYTSTVVPDLVRTPDYARAVSAMAGVDAGRAESLACLLSHRQDVLARPGAARLVAVVDQAVLYRTVGGPVVMRAQLARLAALLDRPGVIFRVVPFTSAAGVPLPHGSLVLLGFDDPADEDVLFQMTPAGDAQEIDPGGGRDPRGLFARLDQVTDATSTRAMVCEAITRHEALT